VFLLNWLGDGEDAKAAATAVGGAVENPISWYVIAVYGAVIGCGAVMPGVSASAILLQFGVYSMFLSALINMDISVLIPLGFGALVGVVIFAKLTNFLLKKFYSYTYYVILGLVAASVILVFPQIGLGFDVTSFVCVVLMLLGFALSYMLGRMQKE